MKIHGNTYTMTKKCIRMDLLKKKKQENPLYQNFCVCTILLSTFIMCIADLPDL